MKALDPVVEANRELLLQRSNVGVEKYGTTLADANLTERELLQHALEETLDLSNYIQALLMRPTAEKAGGLCKACDGKGGWVTAEWVDPVSGPECEGERCDVCEGTGKEPAVPAERQPVNSVALNLEAQLRAVVAERDALRRAAMGAGELNAARYQLLRQYQVRTMPDIATPYATGEKLDAAIDAELQRPAASGAGSEKGGEA